MSEEIDYCEIVIRYNDGKMPSTTLAFMRLDLEEYGKKKQTTNMT